ncbi:hypothetical protein TRFO_11025 [Tritrichomonas foetus]|uniref:RING-type domain-containing protein n=1 Tax=Tritrichomonas foetus TaxID=1144522 RepID=A0A1J4JBL3_9EUKA|nr:hypothetical protein TRFO_11025 [Tritrichomonas foetus]|eukprot:OHS94636.1 hypothetical protein TRFO_11025 [Tritrichomonas foetus]
MTSVKTVKALLDSGVDINIPGVDKTRLEKIKSGEITDCNEEEEITEEEAANESNEPAETSRELINQLLEKKLSRRAELSTAEVFQSVIDNRSNELNEILADIDVNVTIFDDETLLHAAVYNHSVESIPILLEKGANVDAKTATVQESPLQIAVQENMVDVITLLLDNNADIETTNIDNETPLFTAIRFGRKEAFDLLLEKNAKYDIVNNEGCTPLIVAIQLHRKDMALKLLKLNADLTIGNENPVLIAQNSGELEIVDMISNKNPNLRVKSRCASRAIKKPVESPVYDAIKSKNYILLRRLLAKPIELNIDDPKYGIPLFKAIEAGSLDCVKLLLRAGADIEFRVNKTAIEQAIESKHRDIVEYLIEEGADLTETDKNSENPVFYAVRAKDASLVELVINRGSSVNVVNYSNMSPLYVAVGLKQKDVIQVLLKYHADPNNTGLPCLRLAKQLRDQEIMDILSKNGAATEMKRTAHSNRVRSQLQSRTAPIKARNLPPPKNEECMICKKKNDLVKLIPCGHQLACKTCLPVFAEKFQTCPICKVALFACKT